MSYRKSAKSSKFCIDYVQHLKGYQEIMQNLLILHWYEKIRNYPKLRAKYFFLQIMHDAVSHRQLIKNLSMIMLISIVLLGWVSTCNFNGLPFLVSEFWSCMCRNENSRFGAVVLRTLPHHFDVLDSVLLWWGWIGESGKGITKLGPKFNGPVRHAYMHAFTSLQARRGDLKVLHISRNETARSWDRLFGRSLEEGIRTEFSNP